MSNEELKPLQFVSNVIELKPDKKYLLVFKLITHHQLEQVNDYLRKRGFDCACISAPDGEVQVIEAPNAESKSFWEQMAESMTINERRAVFAKLLGISVDEQGKTELDSEKEWMIEESKRMTRNPFWKDFGTDPNVTPV